MFSEDLERTRTNHLTNLVYFFGVVEDIHDPMTLGRVKVRCFNFHPEDTNEVPTEALPWATVLQPTTSAAMGGIGDSPNGLKPGSWVYGFFADGEEAQKPFVTHSVPGIHRPEPSGVPSGTSSGYLDEGSYSQGDTGSEEVRPYHNERVENTTGAGASTGFLDEKRGSEASISTPNNGTTQGEGAMIANADMGMYLHPKDKPKFKELGLVTYSGEPCPNGYACKDGKGSLKFHYGTALALEKLTKEYGKGKLFLNSAYRSPEYNRRVGGAKSSMHMAGHALDISKNSIGRSQADIARFAKLAVKCGFVGFGLYDSFLHIDTGTGRVWNGAKAAWFVKAITEAGWFPKKKGLSGVKTSTGQAASNDTTGGAEKQNGVNVRGDNQQRVYNALKAKGYKDHEIAGIMGNFQVESGFNPGAVNPNDKGRRSTGLAQWRAERETALFDYTGTKTPTIEQQVDFMDRELKTTHKKAYTALKNSSNSSEAAYNFGRYYEVYEGHRDVNSPSSRKRIKAAEDFSKGRAIPESSGKGFVDPTNSYPSPEYRGEPSTNMAARGFNTQSNQRRIINRDNGRMTGIPAAGEVGTFGEPELAASPQYPYNHVRSTTSGHLMEMDDTPGSERINIEHSSGSGVEIFSDGKTVYRSKGNSYAMDEGDSYHGINGKFFQTSINDMNIRTTADLTQQADGSVNIIIGNDGSALISGDYTLSVGEDIKVKGGARVVIEGNAIDILSHTNINMEAKAAINMKAETINMESTGATSVKAGGTIAAQAGGTFGMKSGGAMNLDSGGNMGVKAPTVFVDDVVRLSEGGAASVGEVKGNEGADTADLGKPPSRKKINKDNLKNTTNSERVITTQDTADHYSQFSV